MHVIIPIRAINECVICYQKTLNRNICVQCKRCILCKDCLDKELKTCPLCRKENFKKVKEKPSIKYRFNTTACYKYSKTCCMIILLTFVCFLLGSFVKLMSGDAEWSNIDLLINTVLGLICVGCFLLFLECIGIRCREV